MPRSTRSSGVAPSRVIVPLLIAWLAACSGAKRPAPTPEAGGAGAGTASVVGEAGRPAAGSAGEPDVAGGTRAGAREAPAVVYGRLVERLDSSLVAGARTTVGGGRISTADPHLLVELAPAVEQEMERALRSAAEQLSSAGAPDARRARLAEVLEAVGAMGFALGQRSEVMDGRRFPNSGMQIRFGVDERSYRTVKRQLCPIHPFC